MKPRNSRRVWIVAACIVAASGGVVAARQIAGKTFDLAAAVRKDDGDGALYALDDGANFRAVSELKKPRTAARLALVIAEHLSARYFDVPIPPQNREKLLPAFQWLVRGAAATDPKTRALLLGMAAQIGDGESVRFLVAGGADVNAHAPTQTYTENQRKVQYGGETPLLWAARYRERFTDRPPPDPDPVVVFLLAHGADANAADAQGDTPLIGATAANKIGTVRALLAAHADPNHRNRKGESALSAAQNRRSGPLVALLAPLATTDLFEAATANDASRVRELLCAGARPDAARSESHQTPLMAAAKSDAADAARVLLDAGASVSVVDALGRNALHRAAAAGSLRVAALLLDHGADPNAAETRLFNGRPATGAGAERTPLVTAVGYAHAEMVELLVKRGASLRRTAQRDAVGEVLSWAQRRWSLAQRKSVLAALSAAGLNGTDGVAVARAAQAANPELLLSLLEAGGSPNGHLVDGRPDNEATALTLAISTVAETRSEPPVSDAAAFGKQAADARRCFDLLLAHGANPNEATAIGETALMYAVTVSAFDLADVLLKHGVRIDAADKSGRTALMRAAAGDDDNVRGVTYLLAHGASRAARDKNGDTALSLARKKNHLGSVLLLMRATSVKR